MERGVPRLLATALRPASTYLTSTNHHHTRKEDYPGAVGAGAHPGTPGAATYSTAYSNPTPDPKPGISTSGNHTSGTLND